jgi:hypothetical protein
MIEVAEEACPGQCPSGVLNTLGFEQFGALEAWPFASIFLKHK